jgi:hypothetical protein
VTFKVFLRKLFILQFRFALEMPIKSDYPDVYIDERQFAVQFLERLDVHAHNPQKIAIVSF